MLHIVILVSVLKCWWFVLIIVEGVVFTDVDVICAFVPNISITLSLVMLSHMSFMLFLVLALTIELLV